MVDEAQVLASLADRSIMELGYIYKVTNKINYLCYIGQTVNFDDRVQVHKRAKNNTHLHHTIRKYGVENFIFEILERWPKETLAEREKTWIAFYNTFEGEGYNMTPGGDGAGSGNNHPSKRPEVRRKISDSWTPERRKEASERNKEFWTPERRKEASENNPMKRSEVVEKMKESWTLERRKEFSDNHPTKRPEVRRKISDSWTPERRKEASENNPMKRPEVVEKFKESKKIYWANKRKEKEYLLKEAGQLDLFEG